MSGADHHDGTGEKTQDAERQLVGGNAEADLAARDYGVADARGQAIDSTFGLRIGERQGHGPGPAAPGQTLADRRELRYIIEDFVGAADRESRRAVELAVTNCQQALHAAFGEAAGGSDIDGFGREGDDFAFDEGLNDTMDRVARVAGSEVENLRRHAVFSRFQRPPKIQTQAGDDAEIRSAGAQLGS